MPKIFKRKNEKAAEPLPEPEATPESAKALEEYDRSFPIQLRLFEYLQPEERQYSNTIEIYDFMPKYHWGKSQRINGKFLESLEREFECRGTKYKIEVVPVRIKSKDGKTREYYPSKREELVEDALRRFATAKQGVFLDDRAGGRYFHALPTSTGIKAQRAQLQQGSNQRRAFNLCKNNPDSYDHRRNRRSGIKSF